MFRKLGQYIPLQTDEEAKPMENGAFRTRQSDSSRIWMIFYRIYSITLHVLTISVIILLSYSYKEHSGSKNRLLPSELPFAQNAVQYEEVTFDPSGFWKEPSEATPYEGPPSIKTEEMWSRLTDVGMYSLTKEEYEQLSLETTSVPEKPDQYLVTIEVFHQLHCLNYLRKHLYGIGPLNESESSKTMHLSHCVDYLRQVLMCHSDLTPITLMHDKMRLPPVMPDFNIRHTCRNFDRIWDFAAKRNLSGISID